MLTFTLRRIAGSVGALVVVSFIVFGALYLAPGDPLGFLTGGHPVSPSTLNSIRAQYHLDDPFLYRYWLWATDALSGNFGKSIVTRENVSTLILSRLPQTLFLLIYASILILFVGVGSGIVAGTTRRRRLDGLIVYGGTVALAIPSFVLAILLILLFAVEFPLFPVFGTGSGFLDRLWHMTLPAVALALSSSAYLSRVTRVAAREQFNKEHVETARIRGLPQRQIVGRHVVRNALIPIVTASGLVVAGLIPVSAVIEQIFGLNGIGAFLVTSAENKDFSVVQATTLVLVALFLVINTVVDILYFLIDPRLRVARKG